MSKIASLAGAAFTNIPSLKVTILTNHDYISDKLSIHPKLCNTKLHLSDNIGLLTNCGGLGAASRTSRPQTRGYLELGPDALLEVARLVMTSDVSPVTRTDGPMSQVSHTLELRTAGGQGGHRQEGQGDDQELLLAGWHGDDQPLEASQWVVLEDGGQALVCQGGGARHCH